MAELSFSEKAEPLFQWLVAEEGDPLYYVDTVVETGGRYSSKSYMTGTFSCVAAKDFVHRVLYTRYAMTSAEDSIIPEFIEKLDLLDCRDQFRVTKDRIIGIGDAEGSKIVFKGIKTSSGNQTAALKSLKGFSMFILEEAEEMPSFEDWDKIRKSIRALDVRNLNILILNPTIKTHWIYKELFEANCVPEGFNGVKDNVLYIHTTYLDIDPKYIPNSIFLDFEDKREAYEEWFRTPILLREKLDKLLLKKAMYYKHTIAGGWLNNAEGVVFDNWSIGDFDDDLSYEFGQDYGFAADPSTLVKVAVNVKKKKIYVKSCFGKAGMSTNDLYLANLSHAGTSSLITADSAEPRLISEIKILGLNIKACVKGSGSVTAGIKAMQDYEIIISPCSTAIVTEFNNYVWHDKKSGVPVDAWNHYIDPIRYVAWPIIKGIKQNSGAYIDD